ncbi:MAG TPA: GTP cyclohydrolase I FolE [Bryobacteraceae bacterium]|nr:GTP cyclohydrolase I FolE [Bryobacteraceae bacterium]
MKTEVKLLKPKQADSPSGIATDESIAPLVEDMLRRLGEDPEREGLVKTPERVDRALRYLTSGYGKDVRQVVNGALFTVKYDEMVIVKDIEFFSMCEHHLLPFFGKMHVAYLPKDRVVGLSKIPRIVDMFARRLQLQERLTQDVAQSLQDVLDPLGVGVVCEARHFCMMMRGVEKQHSGAITSAMLGAFRDRKTTRDEFLSLLRQNTTQL